MRRAVCASILPRFFFASSEKAIVQAKVALNFFETIGPAAAVADGDQLFFGRLEVFKVLKVAENGFTRIVSLGAAGTLRNAIKSLFDIGRESNGKHREPLLYKYSSPP